ncbi:MAG: hypothetical protein ABS873_04495 [Alkalibacterium sp.]
MTQTEENVAYIKWKNDQTELVDLLKGYKKADLLKLAESHGVPVRKSWNKAKISASVGEKITEQAETIYHPVLEDVLTRLPDLETNVYRMDGLNEIVGFIPLINKGFFFVTQDGDSIFLLIPEEILFSVKDRIDLEKETKEISSQNSRPAVSSDDRKAELLNSWKEKTETIYGTVSLKHLQTTWNRYADEQLSIDEIKNLLD